MLSYPHQPTHLGFERDRDIAPVRLQPIVTDEANEAPHLPHALRSVADQTPTPSTPVEARQVPSVIRWTAVRSRMVRIQRTRLIIMSTVRATSNQTGRCGATVGSVATFQTRYDAHHQPIPTPSPAAVSRRMSRTTW